MESMTREKTEEEILTFDLRVRRLPVMGVNACLSAASTPLWTSMEPHTLTPTTARVRMEHRIHDTLQQMMEHRERGLWSQHRVNRYSNRNNSVSSSSPAGTHPIIPRL